MHDDATPSLKPLDAALIGLVLVEFVLWTNYPWPSPSQVYNVLFTSAPSRLVHGISRYTLIIRGAANLAAMLLAASALTSRRWSRFLRLPALATLFITLVCIPVAGEVALRNHDQARLYRGEISALQAHDGMIQTEIAADLLRHGLDPYAVDYAPTLMGRAHFGQNFFSALGYPRNPALAHVPYPPAFIALVSASRALFGPFDLRWLIFAFTVALALALARDCSPSHRALVATAVVLCPLTGLSLISGLNDAVHLFPVALGALALRRKNFRAAALAWGLAIALKQLDVLLLPGFFALAWPHTDRRERAVLAALALGPLVLSLLPFALWHPRALFDDLVLFQTGHGPEPYPIHPRSSAVAVLTLGLELADKAASRDPLGPLWLLISLGSHYSAARTALRERDPRSTLRAVAFAVFVSLAASRNFAFNYAALPAVLLYLGLLPTLAVYSPLATAKGIH